MTVQVFGVDQTYAQSFVPQITVSSTSPLTVARLTQISATHAAKINGLLEAAGLTPADIAADTSTALYANCARLVFHRALPSILGAAHGPMAVQPDVNAYDAQAERDIASWVAKPQSLGEDVGDTVDPGIIASTQAKSLDTTDSAVRGRRRYDRRRDRNTGNDDTHRW